MARLVAVRILANQSGDIPGGFFTINLGRGIRYAWFAFFYLTFWTTLAPLVLFLHIFLEILFQSLLQIVKGILIRLREAFSRFEIFSPCSNAPLSVQEGFTIFL